MKKIRVSAAAVLAVLAAEGAAAAQERREPPRFTAGDYTFLPEIDVRIRGEGRNHAPDFEVPRRLEDTWGVLTRARVGVAVERDFLRAKVTLQDARYVGRNTASLVVPTTFGPYEAYAEATTSAARPSFVRIGRQPVEWGEGRLLGVADFSPTGRSLDAVRARGVLGDFEIEGLAALVTAPTSQVVDPRFSEDVALAPSRSGTQLVAARVGYTFAPLLTVEAFGFARWADTQPAFASVGSQTAIPSTISTFAHRRARSDIYTASLRISGRDDALSYGLEGSVQAGSANDYETWKPVSAFAFSGRVERRFASVRLRPTLRALGGYASGGERGGALHHFDPLLPDTQRWHGRFDLFGFSNLADVGGQIEIAPTPWLGLNAGYRYAHLANAKGEWVTGYLDSVGAPRDAGSGALGNEVSFGLDLEPVPGLTFAASYAFLALGESGRAAYADRARQGGYLGNVGDDIAPSATHYLFLQTRVRFP